MSKNQNIAEFLTVSYCKCVRKTVRKKTKTNLKSTI